MISFGTDLAIALYLIGVMAFILNGGHNLLMMVIALELILFAVGFLLVNLSFSPLMISWIAGPDRPLETLPLLLL